MEQEQKEITRLTLRMGDTKSTWEIPDSGATIDEVIEGMYGVLVAQTFSPFSVLKAMAKFVIEHSDKFKESVLPCTTAD